MHHSCKFVLFPRLVNICDLCCMQVLFPTSCSTIIFGISSSSSSSSSNSLPSLSDYQHLYQHQHHLQQIFYPSLDMVLKVPFGDCSVGTAGWGGGLLLDCFAVLLPLLLSLHSGGCFLSSPCCSPGLARVSLGLEVSLRFQFETSKRVACFQFQF